jgi:hypothetical protein
LGNWDFNCRLGHSSLDRTLGKDGFNLPLRFDGSLRCTVNNSFLDWSLSNCGLWSMLVGRLSMPQ